MRFGLFLPIFDDLADPRLLGDLAAEAEQAGWDGVFVWDHVYYRPPIGAATDPWTALACIAMSTSTVLFGPMVTPIARRRPHVVARQAVALDQLSGGRFVMGVGLGLDSSGNELSRFGEEMDDRARAAMLNEGLGLLRALWSGDPVSHRGDHYTASDVQFRPTPVAGHLPIWVAGRWPNRRPMRRAAGHDGLFIIDVDTPASLAVAADVIRATRGSRGLEGFEIVVELDAAAPVAPWEQAGATWGLAGFDPFTATAKAVRERIRRGPNR